MLNEKGNNKCISIARSGSNYLLLFIANNINIYGDIADTVESRKCHKIRVWMSVFLSAICPPATSTTSL